MSFQGDIIRALGVAAAGATAYKAKKDAANKLLEKQEQVSRQNKN